MLGNFVLGRLTRLVFRAFIENLSNEGLMALADRITDLAKIVAEHATERRAANGIPGVYQASLPQTRKIYETRSWNHSKARARRSSRDDGR